MPEINSGWLPLTQLAPVKDLPHGYLRSRQFIIDPILPQD